MTGNDETTRTVWHKVLEPDELAEGRVAPVTCGGQTLCMTRFEGQFGALDNRCPHQGGPLGEGSIENGMLRCPWHGWDFHPLTGGSPGGFDDGVSRFLSCLPQALACDGLVDRPSWRFSAFIALRLCSNAKRVNIY